MPALIPACAALLALLAGGAFLVTGKVQERELGEISGLAASRIEPGLFWAINDSGNAPILFGIDFRGRARARVKVRGANNFDWEDLGAFEQHGRSYLAIADIGDNLRWRSHLTIYIVPEPAAGDSEVAVERTLRFSYEDGARDAEALAIDGHSGTILVLEKRKPPASLYALPLDTPPGTIAVARRVAGLPAEWQAPSADARERFIDLRVRNYATAMDLSRDGRELLVLTYRQLLRFRRAPGADWDAALEQAPRVEELPRMRGFEAACYDPDDRSIWITREGIGAELVWFKPDARHR